MLHIMTELAQFSREQPAIEHAVAAEVKFRQPVCRHHLSMCKVKDCKDTATYLRRLKKSGSFKSLSTLKAFLKFV